MPSYSDADAARALVAHVGDSRWEGATYARGFLAIQQGKTDDEAAREMYDRGPHTLTRFRQLAPEIRTRGFLHLLSKRVKVGSAENAITKLFPATITEQRFLESLDALCEQVSGLSYTDERESGHSLLDFMLHHRDHSLPVNVKNAGTRFERAQQLVGLDPSDCIPIPAYKAHGAIEVEPNLLYAIAVDYDLVGKLSGVLPSLLNIGETIVWDLLSNHTGGQVRTAEDAFIFGTTRKYWKTLRGVAEQSPYHVISARKAIRILQTKPKRTPGIGLRAWGTGASAEVNVHVSIGEDTTPWNDVEQRIVRGGVEDIVKAVNRKQREWVYDPEI